MGNEQGKVSGSVPAGMQAIGQRLQRRFARGVQYNMKIVIKGDRNTGKSCLLRRLQGGTFKEEYLPSKEIQVANIQWNYRATDDIVKVDVWDVVDKGQKKKTRDSLKLFNEGDPREGPLDLSLDAEFVDVYKGTHGVVLVLDITKNWTWTYVQNEVPRIPSNIPVLILSNYRDMGDHRVVRLEEIQQFIEEFKRGGENAASLYHAESSMKNAYGLKYLYSFLNIPFLKLQNDTLRQLLTRNEEEMKSTLEELALMRGKEEQNYDMFEDMLEKRRQEHEKETGVEFKETTEEQRQKQENLNVVAVDAQSKTGTLLPQQQLRVESAVEAERKESIGSRLFSRFKSKFKGKAGLPQEKQQTAVQNSDEIVSHKMSTTKTVNVDEFVPDEKLDASFFGGVREDIRQPEDDNESGEEEGNPMVTGDVDVDFDDEDIVSSNKQQEIAVMSSQRAMSEASESEEEEKSVANVVDVDVASVKPIEIFGTPRGSGPAVKPSPDKVMKQKKADVVASSPSESEEEVVETVVAVNEDIDGGSLSEEVEDEEKRKREDKARAEAAALDIGPAMHIPSGLDAWLESMEADIKLPEPMVASFAPVMPKSTATTAERMKSEQESPKEKKHRKHTERSSKGGGMSDEKEKKKKKKHRHRHHGKEERSREGGSNSRDYELIC